MRKPWGSFMGSSCEEPERVFLYLFCPDVPLLTIGAQHLAALVGLPSAYHGEGQHRFHFHAMKFGGGGYIRFLCLHCFLQFKFFTRFTSPPSLCRSPRTRRAAAPSGLRTCERWCVRGRLPTYRHPPVCRPLPHLRCR